MINYTLNDNTQQMLLPHLKNTEELLSRVATKLSGKNYDGSRMVLVWQLSTQISNLQATH